MIVKLLLIIVIKTHYYLILPVDCIHEINDLRGVIESPNFPTNYPNNLNCEWTINPPPGNKVFLEFSDFELEYSNEDDESTGDNECSFDHLEISEIDADNNISKKSKYCNNMPKSLTTSNKVKVR